MIRGFNSLLLFWIVPNLITEALAKGHPSEHWSESTVHQWKMQVLLHQIFKYAGKQSDTLGVQASGVLRLPVLSCTVT